MTETLRTNRRAWSLSVLSLGMMGLICLGLVRGNSSVAAAIEGPTVDRATVTISRFLQSEEQAAQAMEQLLLSSQQVVEELSSSPVAARVPLNGLRANPFRAAIHKNDQTDANTEKLRQQERRQVLDGYQRLTLNSLKYNGKPRTCVINNTLLQEGHSVQGFVVEQIDTASVTVRNGSYRFELRLP